MYRKRVFLTKEQMSIFSKMATSRDQYLVGVILASAIRSVNSLHNGPISAIESDINCIAKIGANIITQVNDASIEVIDNMIDETIALLQETKRINHQQTVILK